MQSIALYLAAFTAIVAFGAAVAPRFAARHSDKLTYICLIVVFACLLLAIPAPPMPV